MSLHKTAYSLYLKDQFKIFTPYGGREVQMILYDSWKKLDNLEKIRYTKLAEERCLLEISFLEALKDNDFIKIDNVLNKLDPWFLNNLRQKEKIKKLIETRKQINIILLSKKTKDNLCYIPKDMYISIIQKFLYPSLK